MGILKDSTDIFTTHLILAGIMLLLVLVVMRYINKRLGVKKVERNSIYFFININTIALNY